MSQDSQNPADPNDPQQQSDNAEQKPVKRRRRRRWPWVILALFLLVIGLVLLGPTIASTGPVRSFVLGKVNERLTGNVEISDWSLGWFSPIEVKAIKVYDDQKRLILDVPKIALGISIYDAAKQSFAFGNDNVIEIASFDIRVDETGKSNLEKIVKALPYAPEPAANVEVGPLTIPNVTGKFTINILQGTLETPGAPPVHVDPSTIVVTIVDINKPIEESVKLAYHIGDDRATTSTIETSGSVDAIENNQLAIDKLVATQKIVLQKVNLAAAPPFVKRQMPDLKLEGLANGTLDLSAKGLTGVSAKGDIQIAKFLFGGGPLGAEQFKTEKIAIPIGVTRTVGPKDTIIKIEKVGVEMSQLALAITGEVNEQALINLSKQQAPGADGTISIQANVTDPKDLANQLRKTLKLDPSVQIDGGKISNDVAITINKESVKAAVKVNADAKGRRGTQPIELKPIAMAFDATAIPTGKPIPNVKDVKLNVTSDFINVTGGGESLAKIDIKGDFSLDKLRNQAAQFADLSKIQLQGKGDFAVNTSGDVADPNAPITASSTINLADVKVVGVLAQPVDQDKLAIALNGKINRKDNAPIGVDGGTVKITSGDPASPLLTVNASADVDLSNKDKVTSKQFKFAVDTSNLKQLQAEYGGLVPVLAEKKIEITSGGFHVNGGGSFDGTNLALSDAINMSAPSLDVKMDGKQVMTKEVIRATLGGTISLAKDKEGNLDKIGANLSALSLTTQSGRLNIAKAGDSPLNVTFIKSRNDLSGDGTITLASNVKSVVDLAQLLSPATQPATAQLRRAQFNGTIALKKTDATKIDFDGKLTELTVASGGKNVIDNEQLTIAMNAVAPNDLSGNTPIAISGKVGSSFVNTTLSDVKVLLSAKNVMDMLQSATVDTQAPDLAKLHALAQSFMPAAPTAPAPGAARGRQPTPAPAVAAAPLAPLEVSRGAAMVKMNVQRTADTTAINVTDMQLTNLRLNRGERIFEASQPIALKLAASVKADSPDNIDSIKVDQLSGSTQFATFQATQPILISNLTGAQPSLNGELKATGDIDSALPLLAVLKGDDAPAISGKFDLTQKLTTSGNQTGLVGAINVTDFKVLDVKTRRNATFTEKQIAIRNDVALDMAAHNASVNTFTVDMPQSQALAMKFNGQVVDWVKARQIKGVNEPAAKLNVTYDLEKLWPIVYALLDSELQEQYKPLKVKGKFTRDFTVSGSMPDVPEGSNLTSLAKLSASGNLSVESLYLPQGLTMAGFELPFKMTNGRFETQPAPQAPGRLVRGAAAPTGRRGSTAAQDTYAKTAIANDGALNLDQIVLELDKKDMPLSIVRRHVLLNNVKLNPILADALGSGGGFLFKDASKAEGFVDLTVQECDHVPLGDLLRKKSGKATLVLQVEKLNLDGPIPKVLALAGKWGTEGIMGNIPPSTISLANGEAQTNITINIDTVVKDQRGRDVTEPAPLKLTGGMGLSDLKLRNVMVDIHKNLLREEILRIAPNGASIPMTGNANSPKLDIAKFIQENAVRGILGGNDNPLGNILGGNRDGRAQEPPPRNPPRPNQ